MGIQTSILKPLLSSFCLATLFHFPVLGQEDKKIYIPLNLDDAVSVLRKDIKEQDKEKIRKGGFDATDMHLGLGMGVRNRWGLRRWSRLAKYFNSRGIIGAETMSVYILEAFCRDLRGENYDLLEMARDRSKEFRVYHSVIMKGDKVIESYSMALLYHRIDYDDEKRIVMTSLDWDPRDGKIYFTNKGANEQIASSEEISELKKDKEHWIFSEDDLKTLRRMKEMTLDERLKFIISMNKDLRLKMDHILPRTKDPNGLDNDDLFGPYKAGDDSGKRDK